MPAGPSSTSPGCWLGGAVPAAGSEVLGDYPGGGQRLGTCPFRIPIGVRLFLITILPAIASDEGPPFGEDSGLKGSLPFDLTRYRLAFIRVCPQGRWHSQRPFNNLLPASRLRLSDFRRCRFCGWRSRRDRALYQERVRYAPKSRSCDPQLRERQGPVGQRVLPRAMTIDAIPVKQRYRWRDLVDVWWAQTPRCAR